MSSHDAAAASGAGGGGEGGGEAGGGGCGEEAGGAGRGGGGGEDEAARPPLNQRSPRRPSSKYDFVKVRVWLGQHSDHYYVLSRFLLSRTLTVTKIPSESAVKIALELKKLMVDNNLLDVSQSDLESNLFKVMERRGFGAEYISRYRMMTRFHHARAPLVVVVCGSACSGKSTLATHLAQRLNLPNVLQTDLVYELLRATEGAPLAREALWDRPELSGAALVDEYRRECRVVRKGVEGDLDKCVSDGKPIIMEGLHLDPGIYLNVLPAQDQPDGAEPNTHNNDASTHNHTSTTEQHNDTHTRNHSEEGHKEGENNDSSSKPSTSGAKEGDNITTTTTTTNNNNNNSNEDRLMPPPPPTTSSRGIVVPFVLAMSESDHALLVDDWIATRYHHHHGGGGGSVGDGGGNSGVSQEGGEDGGRGGMKERLLARMREIQDYLLSYEDRGVAVVRLTAGSFPAAVDQMHDHVLACIERDFGNNDSASPLSS